MISRKTLLDDARARRAKRDALGRHSSTNPAQSVGASVLALRKKLGMSQQTFADYIGIKRITVQSWESGRRAPAATAMLLFRYIRRYGAIR